MDFPEFIKLFGENSSLSIFLAWFAYFLYQKSDTIFNLGHSFLQKKILITHSELLEHSFFKILKYNTLNNIFIQITKESEKEDFKFYIANALNYITQYYYLKNFHEFIENSKNLTTENLLVNLSEVLNKTEQEILCQIEKTYGTELREIYDENTMILRNFYVSLLLNITEYEQFNINNKLYTILNTLMFVTKTNENSLFQLFLKMNGRLEVLQDKINLPSKINLIEKSDCTKKNK